MFSKPLKTILKQTFPQQISLQQFDKKYKDIIQIGSGSQGDVYSAKIQQNDQLYAIKYFKKQFICKQKIKYISSQIQILTKLKSPHIINIIGSYEKRLSAMNSRYFIVTQYCQYNLGQYDIIRQLSQQNKWKMYHQIISGIKYAHDQNVMHRDIKPQNILIKNKINYQIKLADFGCSKQIEKLPENLSATSFVGTPRYADPLIQKGKYTMKCDIYSLGIIVMDIFYGSNIYTQCKNHMDLKKKQYQMFNNHKKTLKNYYKQIQKNQKIKIHQQTKILIQEVISKTITDKQQNRYNANQLLEYVQSILESYKQSKSQYNQQTQTKFSIQLSEIQIKQSTFRYQQYQQQQQQNNSLFNHQNINLNNSSILKQQKKQQNKKQNEQDQLFHSIVSLQQNKLQKKQNKTLQEFNDSKIQNSKIQNRQKRKQQSVVIQKINENTIQNVSSKSNYDKRQNSSNQNQQLQESLDKLQLQSPQKNILNKLPKKSLKKNIKPLKTQRNTQNVNQPLKLKNLQISTMSQFKTYEMTKSIPLITMKSGQQFYTPSARYFKKQSISPSKKSSSISSQVISLVPVKLSQTQRFCLMTYKKQIKSGDKLRQIQQLTIIMQIIKKNRQKFKQILCLRKPTSFQFKNQYKQIILYLFHHLYLSILHDILSYVHNQQSQFQHTFQLNHQQLTKKSKLKIQSLIKQQINKICQQFVKSSSNLLMKLGLLKNSMSNDFKTMIFQSQQYQGTGTIKKTFKISKFKQQLNQYLTTKLNALRKQDQKNIINQLISIALAIQ